MSARPSPSWELVKYGGVSLVVIGLFTAVVGGIQLMRDAGSPWVGFASTFVVQMAAWPLVLGAVLWVVGHEKLRSAKAPPPR